MDELSGKDFVRLRYIAQHLIRPYRLISTTGSVLTNPEFAKTVSSVGQIAGPIALGAATGGTSTALSSIAGPLLGAVSG
jgi:hypothetical protein